MVTTCCSLGVPGVGGLPDRLISVALRGVAGKRSMEEDLLGEVLDLGVERVDLGGVLDLGAVLGFFCLSFFLSFLAWVLDILRAPFVLTIFSSCLESCALC